MRGVDSFESAACLFSFVRSGHDKKVTARFFFQRGMSLYKTFYGVYKKSWGHEKEKKTTASLDQLSQFVLFNPLSRVH